MKICQMCGNVNKDALKFCEDCGNYLGASDTSVNNPDLNQSLKLNNSNQSLMFNNSNPMLLFSDSNPMLMKPAADKTVYIKTDDSDLYLLCDCCHKTCGLPTGNRYTEIVLYRDDKGDTYQIHTYAGDERGTTAHKAYYTDKEFVDKVDLLIEEEGIIKYKNATGAGMCGAEFIVKFRDGNGELVRISTGNFGNEGIGSYNRISSLLYSGIREEKAIVAE